MAVAAVNSGCGGGLPLLHPAQPLPSGVTSLSAGVGSQWVGGRANHLLDNANVGLTPAPTAQSVDTASAVAASVYSPGLFPWLSMRLGLGYDSEAGVSYTGRRARIDARHAWMKGRWALSMGAGAGLSLAHPAANSENGTSAFEARESISGLDTSDVRAFAVDVPLVVGWRSSADIARVWLGLRPTYEHVYGTLLYTQTVGTVQGDVSANALTTSGIFGFAIGLRPLYVAMELSVGGSVARGSVSGALGGPSGSSASLSALTMTPAAALIWEVR